MPPSLFPIAIKCGVMKSNKGLWLCALSASAECAERSLAHAMFPYNAHQAGLANFRILSRSLSGIFRARGWWIWMVSEVVAQWRRAWRVKGFRGSVLCLHTMGRWPLKPFRASLLIPSAKPSKEAEKPFQHSHFKEELKVWAVYYE